MLKTHKVDFSKVYLESSKGLYLERKREGKGSRARGPLSVGTQVEKKWRAGRGERRE